MAKAKATRLLSKSKFSTWQIQLSFDAATERSRSPNHIKELTLFLGEEGDRGYWI